MLCRQHRARSIHFNRETVRGVNQYQMLEACVRQMLENFRGRLYMAGWSSYSIMHAILSVLEKWFPEWWIGRCGPISGQGISPDRPTLNFSLWRLVRDQIYRTSAYVAHPKEEKVTAIKISFMKLLKTSRQVLKIDFITSFKIWVAVESTDGIQLGVLIEL